MSRTYRRKNKETSEVYYSYESYYPEGWGFSYIKLSGDALKEALRKFHMEGRYTYGYAPFKCYRKENVAKQRMHDKTELHKYTVNSDYEPLVYDKMPMDYWT